MFGDLKFIWVRELHKDGLNVHFHILYFNLPHNTQEQLETAWPHGWIKAERCRTGREDMQKVAGYLAKYMGKQVTEQTEVRLFTPSQNLEQPITYYDPLDVIALMSEFKNAQRIKHWPAENPYTHEQIIYETYLMPPTANAAEPRRAESLSTL
jgi:hypothetical protein